jgi:hypothetical protein
MKYRQRRKMNNTSETTPHVVKQQPKGKQQHSQSFEIQKI